MQSRFSPSWPSMAGSGPPAASPALTSSLRSPGSSSPRRCVRELEATDRIALPAFYGRRVKRLLPALAVVIVFVAVVGSLATPVAATHVAGMTGFFASFFAANAYLYWLPIGLLQPDHPARSAVAHVDAGRGGAVLSRLPGPALRRLVVRDAPWRTGPPVGRHRDRRRLRRIPVARATAPHSFQASALPTTRRRPAPGSSPPGR